jgi:clan AA aspartic protease
MITGIITAAREAVIQMAVRGPSGHTVAVDAVIDTGFTGWLTLPTSLIGTLGLPFAGTTRATLSDGSEVAIDVFAATVVWDSRDRPVTVLATDGGVLVGMAMLLGFRLTIEGAIGGPVQIEALP